MENTNASLALLELHLNNMFSGKTNNQEIQQIQQNLDSFSKQKGVWKDVLYFLNHSLNNNIYMYGLTVLEGIISREWNTLTPLEKYELRTNLYKWLLEKHNDVPFYIRNKTIQLIVHVGRSDWPSEYPEFYESVISLASSPNTTVLGLLFIQTISEELGTSRNDILSRRKEELKVLLLQHLPHTFSLLSGLLQSALERYSHSTVSTPPPSPTNLAPFFCTDERAVRKEIGVKHETLPIGQSSEAITRIALQSLTHFFSWIPSSNYVTPYLLELIFQFVKIGSEESLPHLKSSSEPNIPTLALGAVNEILYKNFFPLEFEEFLFLLFKNTCLVLENVVDKFTKNIIFNQPSEQFIEKIIELVHLLISGHIQRLEKRPCLDVNIPHFLSLFYRLTFEQVGWDRYLSCLETWQCFLGHVKQLSEVANHKNGTVDQNSLLSSYSSSLIPLSERVLHQILFMHNAVKLEELDEDPNDENSETEFQKTIHLSAEVFLAAAELTNNQTLTLLTGPFQRCISSYESLFRAIKSTGNVLVINSNTEIKELRYLMKDLATILNLIGRLSEYHLQGDALMPNNQSLVETLLNTASFGNTWSSLKMVGNAENDLKPLLIDVHLQSLSSLQSWCVWLTSWIRREAPHSSLIPVISAFIDRAIDALNSSWCVTMNKNHKVNVLGVELLSSVVKSTRSPLLWNCPSWNKLYASIHEFQHLPPQVKRKFIQIMFSSSIMTWRDLSVEEQHWNERQSRFQVDIDHATCATKNLIESIVREPSVSCIKQGKPLLISTFQLLADIASEANEETTPSKKATCVAIGPIIDASLRLLPFCFTDEEITEALFHLYLMVFDSLLHQIGSSSAEKIIQALLLLYNQHSVNTSQHHEGSQGLKAVEQLLKLFQIIVKEPAASFKKFVPQIINICLDTIHPLVMQVSSTHDVKEAFFQLLHSILIYHWRHFFKGSILTTYQSLGDSSYNEEVANRTQFLSILSIFGQSFVSTELSIFKQNLNAIESLNAKWKLYSKKIFREVVTYFIHTLLNVMYNGFFDLLTEDISTALHGMASPDFQTFFGKVLPSYLASCEGLDDCQRLALKNSFTVETDLPSFTHNVQQFVHDLRYYRTRNYAPK